MQVAKSIKLVMTSRLASIIVTLDMERIRDVQLCIDANNVKESIIQAKIKVKNEVSICFGSFLTFNSPYSFILFNISRSYNSAAYYGFGWWEVGNSSSRNR